MLVLKNLATNAGDIRDVVWIPGSSSPGEKHDNLLQHSCLKNPMERRVWQAMVCRVTKSQTWLKWLSMQVEPVDSRAGSHQAKKLTVREYSHTHQQISGLKLYWAEFARARPSFTHSQSPRSGNLHKLLILIHQGADRRKKNYNSTASRTSKITESSEKK